MIFPEIHTLGADIRYGTPEFTLSAGVDSQKIDNIKIRKYSHSKVNTKMTTKMTAKVNSFGDILLQNDIGTTFGTREWDYSVEDSQKSMAIFRNFSEDCSNRP